MATVGDIDTTSAVNKFLERPVVVSKTEEGADQGDEIAAILESVAISFLLTPQVGLTFILMAKNQLQQIVSKDLELLEYIAKAVGDVDNPDSRVDDVSDLVEAQTALVEIDRLGSFQSATKSFQRYNAAVNRFLDNQLASSLKRRRSGEFERSGTEAKQDLFTALGLFTNTHGVMSQVLYDLSHSVDDFRSVNLTKIVSQKTVARVRASLQQIQRGFQRDTISKTSAAIELLSGAASLESISNSRDIYSPTVETGEFPIGRTISVSSEPAAAFATNTPGSHFIGGASSRQIYIKIDELGPDPYATIIPFTADRPVVRSAPFEGDTLSLPGTPLRLYVTSDHSMFPELELDLISYGTSVDVNTLQTDLNSAFNPAVTVFLNGRADGRREWVFEGDPTTTYVTVRDTGVGSVDDLTGAYTPADPSAHEIFGFTASQTSDIVGFVSTESLIDRLNAQVGNRVLATPFESPTLGSIVKVTSLSTDPWSSIDFDPSTFYTFGFLTNNRQTCQPAALLLIENGQPVDPISLGVNVGSQVTMSDEFQSSRSGVFVVTGVEGNRLLFSGSLPRGLNKATNILPPAVASVQTLLRKLSPFVGTFDEDARNLQQVMSPLLSQQPTQAQIADATKFVTALKARLTNTDQSGLLDVLAAVVVREDQSDFVQTAKSILSALEERGLDRASDFLKAGKFSSFFGLEVEAASSGGFFLKSMEDLMTDSFKTTTIEADQADVRPSAQAPADTLQDLDPSGGK